MINLFCTRTMYIFMIVVLHRNEKLRRIAQNDYVPHHAAEIEPPLFHSSFRFLDQRFFKRLNIEHRVPMSTSLLQYCQYTLGAVHKERHDRGGRGPRRCDSL